jgi:uncharacterized protein with von Willebrand factor type A (vWA) domain
MNNSQIFKLKPPNLQTSPFLHNLLLFGRLLRGLGMDVNPGRMIDLVSVLDLISLNRKDDVHGTMRSLLVHKREEFALFDAAFEAFWRDGLGEWKDVDLDAFNRKPPRSKRPRTTPPPLNEQDAEDDAPNNQSTNNQQPILMVTRTYSDREVLRHKNFGELSGEELNDIKRLMHELVWNLGERRTRRYEPGRGALFDMRRTMRRNLKHGGEMMQWDMRSPKIKPRPLVIIADISGSMERFTRLLLHFLYSLVEGLTNQTVESFVFSTRLTRITRQLRNRDVDAALSEVSKVVTDWNGGTRIGESMKTFNFEWGRRALGHGAVVLVISDGWDRGDPNLLGTEMARLHRSCHRLIWLNPLLGSPEYEPLTRGMQAALPHCDDFLPVHNLKSLEELAEKLKAVRQ